MKNYNDFLKTKNIKHFGNSINVKDDDINQILFPFQRDIVKYSLRKGRSAMFEDTGLGKTFQQIEWARLTGEKTLIIAPLLVVNQTIKEGEKLGVKIGEGEQIEITNYEQIHNIEPDKYGAIVLDESSILKSIDGKTRKALTKAFIKTPYKLCCTATPAPNDIVEICNHAEFLGLMSANETKAMFFVHDSSDTTKWRLKKHAISAFYEWLSSWSIFLQKPSDLGYDDTGYILPELNIKPYFEKSGIQHDGMLFFLGKLKGISHRADIRKKTINIKIQKTKEIIKNSNEQWILWCELNAEGRKLHKEIPDSKLMEGSQSSEVKVDICKKFLSGESRILITKPKMMKFGMNLQNCHNMIFVGLSDSWESFYQCIRRCHRFGQDKQVNVYIVLTEEEKAIYENVMNKNKMAENMKKETINYIKNFEKKEMKGEIIMESEYEKETIKKNKYTLMMGDSVERLQEIDENSVGLSVYSPPFQSLYTYSPSSRDIGNSKNEDDFFSHFQYVIDGLLRATKPGRLTCCHVAQIPAMLVRDGYIGLKDFRGRTIEKFIESGWIHHGEICIQKNPQAQAIRTHSKGLLFTQLRKDSSWLRPALSDFILIFRKPGDNEIPIKPDISNENWIKWANPIWTDIRETNTLNVREGRDNKDERHICPLQLDVIERCIKLWSNEDEIVLSPFAGIGSEIYTALLMKRKAIGIELKRSYFEVMQKNARRAIRKRKQKNGLFENNEME